MFERKKIVIHIMYFIKLSPFGEGKGMSRKFNEIIEMLGNNRLVLVLRCQAAISFD